MRTEIRETLFRFRAPTDPTTPDVVATYDVPKDVRYSLINEENYTILLPAKAYAKFNYTGGGSPSVTVTEYSNDIAEISASLSSGVITVTLRFKSFIHSNLYSIDMLAYFCTSASTPLTYSYNSNTNRFTYSINAPSSSGSFIHYYYYIPRDANYYLVVREDVSGVKVESEVASANTMSFIRYYNDPRSTPRLKGTFVKENATMLIKAYSRFQLNFDPLLPNGSVCPLVFINIPVVLS